MTTLLLAVLVLSSNPSRHGEHGLDDRMRSLEPWKIYNKDRPPTMVLTPRGLRMTLGAVPASWPYEYQWSGARRRITLDVARYPRLIADVPQISKGSYAHLEIAVLNAKGMVVKGIRSGSATEPGQIQQDISTDLLPAIYNLELRLIVGGANTGAGATFGRVRAVADEQAKAHLERPAPISKAW